MIIRDIVQPIWSANNQSPIFVKIQQVGNHWSFKKQDANIYYIEHLVIDNIQQLYLQEWPSDPYQQQITYSIHQFSVLRRTPSWYTTS